MPAMLFRLRNVPEDEADEIRQLLEQKHIDFYETTAGNWGISMPAIWVHEDDDLVRGKELINEYQQQRTIRMRDVYQQSHAQGETTGLIDRLRAKPLQMLGIVLFCLFIIYAMLSPFVRMAQQGS